MKADRGAVVPAPLIKRPGPGVIEGVETLAATLAEAG